MAINEARLQDTLEYITDHPEEHDQSVWAHRTACGTTHCMAGHAVLLSGYEIKWTPDYFGEAWSAELVVGHRGRTRHIPVVAREELGLTRAQANTMFYKAGTLDELWAYASEWTNGRVRRGRRSEEAAALRQASQVVDNVDQGVADQNVVVAV